MNDEAKRALEHIGVSLEQCLDAGAFAWVWRAEYKGVPRALRICKYPLDDSPEGRLVQQERQTLRQIVRIPPLVNRIGFIEEIPSDYYVTAWQLAEANLASWWRSDRASEGQLRRYLRQIASSIDLFNDFGIHLRDVKPENILVDGDHAWLCDLGLSKQVGLSIYRGTVVGTPTFMPREMERFGESHPTNDLYCLAASYLRLKSRLTPSQFLKGRAAPGLKPAEVQVIAEVLHPDPDQRPPGAVAWVARLEGAVGPWEIDQNAIPTVVYRKGRISSMLRSALASFRAVANRRKLA